MLLLQCVGGRTSILAAVLFLFAIVSAEEKVEENQIFGEKSRKIQTSEELISAIIDECFMGDGSTSSMVCLRMKLLSFLDTIMGGAEGRSLDEDKRDSEILDNMIYSRVSKYLKTHQFKFQLPDFVFQRAVLTFRPGRSLADFDVEFPKTDEAEDRSLSEARGMLKKKLLLPLLLLLKLKMKTLMPLWLAIVDLKALKALILSKLALTLIVGFLIMQFCKKAGMTMPMPMMVEPTPPAPPTAYGAPAPSPPSSSYEPGWDTSSSSGGPYSRVWDPHQIAYSAYYSSGSQQPSSQQTSQSSQQSLKF